jgi:hypothetical protein
MTMCNVYGLPCTWIPRPFPSIGAPNSMSSGALSDGWLTRPARVAGRSTPTPAAIWSPRLNGSSPQRAFSGRTSPHEHVLHPLSGRDRPRPHPPRGRLCRLQACGGVVPVCPDDRCSIPAVVGAVASQGPRPCKRPDGCMTADRRHRLTVRPSGALFSEETMRWFLGELDRRAPREKVERLSKLDPAIAAFEATSRGSRAA